MDPAFLSLTELSQKISTGALSSADATAAFLDRIEAIDAQIGAYLTVDREGAMYLSIASDSETSIDADALIAQVKAALVKDPKRPVMVRGDAEGPYQNVVSTLVLLQQAEVGSVGLVTDPEDAL